MRAVVAGEVAGAVPEVGHQHGLVVDAVGLEVLAELELAVDVAFVAEAVLQALGGQPIAGARRALGGGGAGPGAEVAVPVERVRAAG